MVIAVVRVRGIRNMKPKIKKTLELLGLRKPNHCVLLKDTQSIRGMLQIVRDYVAFGEISEETVYSLLSKRGEKGRKKLREILKDDEIRAVAKEISEGKKKVKEVCDLVFRLRPPRKGWKNIKRHYPEGALGKRPDMDDVLKRMI